MIQVYTDGAYTTKCLNKTGWGFVVVEDGKSIYQNHGSLTGDIVSMRQIGGEIMAAKNAVIWAMDKDCKITIVYDYEGVEKWVTGEWKAKNQYTAEYARFMNLAREIVSFQHISPLEHHKGFNKMADSLANIDLL